MINRRMRQVVLGGLLLAATLGLSGCYVGPGPYYGYPGYYRPAPYYGGGYGYGAGGYGYGYGYRPYR